MESRPIKLKHFVFFFAISTIHLAAIIFSREVSTSEQVSKVLLMPSLIVVYFRLTRGRILLQRNMMLGALALSWFGDLALLFQTTSSDFFLLGLICFLLAHALYIFSFNLSDSKVEISLVKRKPWLLLFFVVYAANIFSILYKGLGDMLVPVIVYMCVILAMGMSALNRYRKVSQQSFTDVFLGAVLFLISDSLLAINKFYESYGAASFLIMLTYICAQFFIVKGMIEEAMEK